MGGENSYVVPGVPTGLGFGVGVGCEGDVEDSPRCPYWQPPRAKRRRSAAIFISMRHDLGGGFQGFGRRSHTFGTRCRHPLLANGALGLRPMLIGFTLGSTVVLVKLVGQRCDVFLFSH